MEHQKSFLISSNILDDPQCRQPYSFLTESWRRIKPGVPYHGTCNCDTSLLSRWYRFSFPESPFAKIPSTPPPVANRDWDMRTCGTRGIPWMEDSYPNIGEGPKNVRLNIAWLSNSRWESVSARVVACWERGQIFYLYYLSPIVDRCCTAFCAT